MIRIFIGTSETEDRFIEQILVYSLYKHTSQPLDITFLRPSMFPDWNTQGWGTPFTCFRYAIPAMCQYRGKAIYFDVDQMNLKDVALLWNTDLKGKAFGMVWDGLNHNGMQYEDTEYARGWYSDSVMLIDCEKAEQHLAPNAEIAKSENVYKYEFMRNAGAPESRENDVIHPISSKWNSFDGFITDDPTLDVTHDRRAGGSYDLADIYQLHWTGLSSQPWHPKYTPHGKSAHMRPDLVELLWKYAYEVRRIAHPEEF